MTGPPSTYARGNPSIFEGGWAWQRCCQPRRITSLHMYGAGRRTDRHYQRASERDLTTVHTSPSVSPGIPCAFSVQGRPGIGRDEESESAESKLLATCRGLADVNKPAVEGIVYCIVWGNMSDLLQS